MLVVLVTAVCMQAQTPGFSPFSADYTMTGKEHKPVHGKMFFSGKLMRMDMQAPSEEASPMGAMSTIVDVSNSAEPKIITLMHGQKMYMEMSGIGRAANRSPIPRIGDPMNPCANRPGVTCKKVGTETVNGRMCEKWEFTGKNPGENGTYWIDSKTRFPIKTVLQNGFTMEYTNIKEGPQDPSLFAVPAGYKKFSMGGMMGGHNPGDQEQ